MREHRSQIETGIKKDGWKVKGVKYTRILLSLSERENKQLKDWRTMPLWIRKETTRSLFGINGKFIFIFYLFYFFYFFTIIYVIRVCGFIDATQHFFSFCNAFFLLPLLSTHTNVPLRVFYSSSVCIVLYCHEGKFVHK